MNFRQILANYNPIDCKNKLNKLLAEVERNFGVFSPDMELDIRSIISIPEVVDYFDRIIHESHPVLEHDKEKLSPTSQRNGNEEKKKRKNDAKKKAKKNPLSLWIRIFTGILKHQSGPCDYPKLTRCLKN